jgi:integration host factor subunit beta
MTITKADLVDSIAARTALPKDVVAACVQLILASISDALLQGDKVEIRGFGSFRTRHRGPHLGRNPRTGEPVEVPAKRVPYFTPGKLLREGLLEVRLPFPNS